MQIPSALFTLLVNVIGRSAVVPKLARRAILRLVGVRIGRSSIASGCFIGSPQITIGDRTFVNVGVFFDGLGYITIGDHVHIAMEVMLLTSTHEFGDSDRRAGTLTASQIDIADGAWVGARAIILPGVTIGQGAVIAAGSIVTTSCDPNTVYAGSPARPVRRLDTAEEPLS